MVSKIKTGFAVIDNAKIYYETAGEGIPMVMIHAGVADHRQWNNEFAYFSKKYQVIRYDMRGYGKSEPVDGEFSHLGDLISLLDTLNISEPLILMGCSIGGSLALDFGLSHPSKVRALVMVASGPSGLDLDVEKVTKFDQAEKAFESGDLDLTAEIETQIWFDGIGRNPEQVNPEMRKLLYEMNRIALANEIKQLGKPLPNLDTPAADRLADLDFPVLVMIGKHDIPYILAAADYMVEKIPVVFRVEIPDAAHLPNMDQPEVFKKHVVEFLMRLSE